MAWGQNRAGRMGNGTVTTGSDVPMPVQGLMDVTAISASQFHSMALRSNGTVMAWGGNTTGWLGDGTTTPSDVPVEVQGVTDAVAVAAGNVHSLVLLRDGTVLAFGSDEYGQLGNGKRSGNQGVHDVPTPVNALSEVTAIAAGAFHSLALLRNGTVMAWGWNRSGELGDGTIEGPTRCGHFGCSTVPIPVSGLSGVTAISAASNTTVSMENINNLALLGNGTVMGWGGNEEGQLGDGTTTPRYTPVKAEGLSEVTDVSASGFNGLALASEP